MATSHGFTILVTFGGLFLLGLLADLLGRHSFLPRVTLLMVVGFIVGPSALDWLPAFTVDWFPVLSDVALAMIGFLLGEKLTRKSMRELGRRVIYMSVGEVLTTAILVTALLAVKTFPEHENVILPVVLGATVIFEVAGPVATRWALIRTGQVER